ncbi:MAG: hypothetical protein HY063_03395 [Bacteroidetes bacterium]|nr:hypothetical protein [Bacteroidota bacterium]
MVKQRLNEKSTTAGLGEMRVSHPHAAQRQLKMNREELMQGIRENDAVYETVNLLTQVATFNNGHLYG